MAKSKVRIQLLDETTGAILEEVDVLTSAEAVSFADGETFQQKLDLGKLRGAQDPQGLQGPQGLKGVDGAKGATGAQGPQGIQGTKGDPGDGIKVGTSYATATTAKIFFKKI